MPRALVAGALLLAAPLAQALPCALAPPRSFPAPGSVVPPNVRLVIFARPENKADLAFFESGRLVLESGPDKVPLVREDAALPLASPRGETVLVFRPARPLVAGKSYALGGPGKLSPFSQTLAGKTWTVQGAADKSAPQLGAKAVARATCASTGPEERVCAIALAGKSEEDVLLEGQLKAAEQTMRFADVVPKGGELLLRNEACPSTFETLEGATYQASFRVSDAAGNQSAVLPLPLVLRDVNREMGRIPGNSRHADH